MRFKNRKDAGRQVGEELRRLGYNSDYHVFGLPRGGVPIAFEVARILEAPLDVLIVRKLGVPGQEELAMGALAPGHMLVLNHSIINALEISKAEIDKIVAQEEAELERRTRVYRKGLKEISIENCPVLLIDDGLATGASMSAACEAIKQFKVESIHVAVPVGARETCKMIAQQVEKVICLCQPKNFYGVGQFYDDFSQTTDQEVIELINQSSLKEAADKSSSLDPTQQKRE